MSDPKFNGANVSFVKAVTDYFGKHPDGKTSLLTEMKALTIPDRVELRDMLIAEGYNVDALKVAA